MKTSLHQTLLAVAIAGCCISGAHQATAQVSAESRVSATIVTPMTISQEKGRLEIGGALISVAASGNNAGTIATQAADEVGAEFNITGSPAYAYSISVPEFLVVVSGDKIIRLATEAHTSAAKLSHSGTASVSIEGNVVSAIVSRDAAASIQQEMLLAMNDDDTYVPNGLPVIINNN
jgi:hypothetical protein